MPLQKLPTTGLDDINHRRRARESLNQVLDHSFDDSRRQTGIEKNLGVTPVNSAYQPGDIRRYGAKCDLSKNDSAAVQVAINVAIAGATANQGETAIYVPGRTLCQDTLYIDREVDGANFDTWLRIIGIDGGGFVVDGGVPLFSSTIPFDPNSLLSVPVVQLVEFSGIRFESTDPDADDYVIDDARFLRTVFRRCDFRKIKAMVAETVYTQSIYFEQCQMRRWKGTFFRSAGSTSFDIRFSDCLMEAGEGCVYLNLAAGCRFIGNNMEGSDAHTAIDIAGSQALCITGNYFEGNDTDIDLSAGSHLGVAMIANQFASTTGGAENVYWGIAENCVSIGNYSSSDLHNLSSTSKVTIRDYAVGNITDREGQSELPYNCPGIDFYLSADSDPVTLNTFVKVEVNQQVINTNGDFDNVTNFRHQPTVPGYYSYTGKISVKASGGALTRLIVAIFKNGSEENRVVDVPISLSDGSTAILSGACDEILMNGSTDYVELFGFVSGAGSPVFAFNAASEACRLSGSFVRSVGIGA